MGLLRSLAAAVCCAAALCLASTSAAQDPPAGGTWHALVNQAPFEASTMLLLTDGSVLVQDYSSAYWYKLTPDAFGSYDNGTWTSLASTVHGMLYYASAVLQDGRVIVCGAEYTDGILDRSANCQIYDPLADSWTTIPAPTGWTHVGDAPCCVLPNGKFLMGSIYDKRTAIYDPVSNVWSPTSMKQDRSAEESWALLPDGTVLTAECTNHPWCEKYVSTSGNWVGASFVSKDLVEGASYEIGPEVLLPNGRTFAVGATGHTDVYVQPNIPNAPGNWLAGPDFPKINGMTLGTKDGPACLLPNGNVLCAVAPVDGLKDDYLSPTYMFEYNSGSLTQVAAPADSTYTAPFEERMLVVPTGEVLFSDGYNIYVYEPSGNYLSSWQPTISSVPSTVGPGMTFRLDGSQLNGLSQCTMYGDDASAATNYPLVRIINLGTGHIAYCRTHDHSTMAVATGNTPEYTYFDVPSSIELGNSLIQVVANGIPSALESVVVENLCSSAPSSLVMDVGTAFGPISALSADDSQFMSFESPSSVAIGQPSIQIEFTGTACNLNPNVLMLKLDSFVSRIDVVQTIELYNYSTSAWDLVDSRVAAQTDTPIWVSPSGVAPTNYVAPITGEVKARVTYQAILGTAPFVGWAFVDQVAWIVSM